MQRGTRATNAHPLAMMSYLIAPGGGISVEWCETMQRNQVVIW